MARYPYLDNNIQRNNLNPVWFLVLLLGGLLGACVGSGGEGLTDLELSQTPLVPISSLVPETIKPNRTTADETPAPTVEIEISVEVVQTPTVFLVPSPINVKSFPNPEDYTWQIIADGLDRPVALVSPLDGSGRLLVVEQQGLVYTLQDGELFLEPFLDLRDRVVTTGGVSRGLLGLAFHPKFEDNGYLYVHYTNQAGNSIIARYTASPESRIVDLDSELVLLEISYPVGEHIGGDLAFGPDGYLYISIGDGGGPGYGDQDNNAQNPNSLLGKLLRIDVDSRRDQREAYLVPEDNPYAIGGGSAEVWALGLRNPWRFTFDLQTGELFIGDVGENKIEEINYLPAGNPGGANLGWNYLEGSEIYSGQPPSELDFIVPVVEYDHSQGCSVTGGVVYRGTALPEWSGVYFYGDYCQGKIWGLLRSEDGEWGSQLLYELGAYIVSFGQDENGEVYLVDFIGKIYKFLRN